LSRARARRPEKDRATARPRAPRAPGVRNTVRDVPSRAVRYPRAEAKMTTVGDAGAGRPVLDVGQVRERLGDDDELVADVIRLYLDDYPARIEAIWAAIEVRDAGRLRSEAHALKGSASALSAQRVADAARALEALGEAGNFDPASHRFAALVAEADLLAAVLRSLQMENP